MRILVIAEHNNTELKNATLNTVTAAVELSQQVDILVAGYNCSALARDVSKIANIQQVLLLDNLVYEHHLAENMSLLITELASSYDCILASSNTFGKNLMPRLAALLDVEMLSDITSINSNEEFIRPIYAGNILAKVDYHASKKVITIRSTAFTAALFGDNSVKIDNLDIVIQNEFVEFVKFEAPESIRPELSSAEIVISGGRGLKNKESFALVEKLADKLNAAIGASRAAVDAGFISNDLQVGQTGKIVAPKLYIAVGISGAIQHIAGMKDSKVIVAINKDDTAPIFEIATYGLVGDLFEIVPELINKL